MKSVIKKLIAGIATAMLVAVPATFAISSVAHAQAVNPNVNQGVCEGVNFIDGQGAGCQDGNEEGSNFSSLAKRIVDIFSIVVGAVSVIMIIVGGFRYIISNGDSNGVQGAKNTILYAIVGLVIVLFAQIIVRFILVNATQETT